jgi:hypothetical protein
MKNSLVKFQNQLPQKQQQTITVIDVDGQIIQNKKRPSILFYVICAIIGFSIPFIISAIDQNATNKKIEKIKQEIELNGHANRYSE